MTTTPESPDDEVPYLEDCCLAVVVPSTPLLRIEADEIDPFTGEEVGWPAPVIYWANGTITAGHLDDDGQLQRRESLNAPD